MRVDLRAVAGWGVAGAGLVVSSRIVFVHLTRRPWDTDFRILFSAASVGRGDGWSSIFDPALVAAVEAGIGPPPFFAYLSPPPLAWLAAPFSYPNYKVGLAAWTALLLVSLAAAAWLARPALEGSRLGWAIGAALWASPVVFGLAEGQPVALLALGLVASWRLARSGRDVLAGVALGLTLLKPHTAWLVPLAFAVGGRPRVLLGYLAIALPLAAASLLSLGVAGAALWFEALTHAASDAHAPLFIFRAYLPSGVALAVEAAAVVATLAAALRRRGEASGALLIAIGVAGSFLAAPYLNLQDLALLVVAGWMLWPELDNWRQKALSGCVYLAVFITPASTQLILPAEVVWLFVALSGPRPQATR